MLLFLQCAEVVVAENQNCYLEDVSDDKRGDKCCRLVMKIHDGVKMEVVENYEGGDEECATVVA